MSISTAEVKAGRLHIVTGKHQAGRKPLKKCASSIFYQGHKIKKYILEASIHALLSLDSFIQSPIQIIKAEKKIISKQCRQIKMDNDMT